MQVTKRIKRALFRNSRAYSRIGAIFTLFIDELRAIKHKTMHMQMSVCVGLQACRLIGNDAYEQEKTSQPAAIS